MTGPDIRGVFEYPHTTYNTDRRASRDVSWIALQKFFETHTMTGTCVLFGKQYEWWRSKETGQLSLYPAGV